MNRYYPVFLDVRGKKCVVIGGGKVAFRKVNSLNSHGAKITLVSPEICPELECLIKENGIEWVRRVYKMGDLRDAYLAIAASADHDTNKKASEEASQHRVIINVVDEAELSDFIMPSCIYRGDVTVAVSTGGLSPALARKIRIRLEKEIGEEYAVLARLIGEIRSNLLSQGRIMDAERWQESIDIDRMTRMIKHGDLHKVKDLIQAKLLSSGSAKADE